MYRLKGGKGRSPRYRCSSAQYKQSCGNTSTTTAEADRLVEGAVLTLLGESERMDRVWDSGSDNTGELSELDGELVDLTMLLGTPAYRPGTPQRVALNTRISALADRQAQLSSEATKPSGWVWLPTGEQFGPWWASQTLESQNVWLRQMGVRLEFDHGRFHLDLGDLETMTAALEPAGAAADWQKNFAAMTEKDIAGMEIRADGEVVFHHRDGRTVSTA
jgi:site-specific DNA recombinase